MTNYDIKSKYDGLKLHVKDWKVSNPKAVILIIPGFGDHCERYGYLVNFFNEHNIAVVGIDLRGQGRSKGERGYTENVTAYLEDVTSGIEKVQELYKNVPLFMYGDGIGAAILCLHIKGRSADELPYKALILCTPSIIFPNKPNFIHLALVRAFAYLAPHTRAPVLGGAYEYTNNPKAKAARESDRYFHDRWPAHTAAILCEAGLYFEENAFHFPIPTLIQHGSKAFLPMEKLRNWINKTTGDREFKEWEGFYAELHNDMGRAELFEYTLSWMEKKLESFKNNQAS
ncbi:unnamed protein product [Adineta steineri]|nr:unnamed protein product [Adineta steineri]